MTRLARVRAADRSLRRARARVRAWLRSGRWSRRTARALHNDFDFACIHWWGDRQPSSADLANRDFGGHPTGVDDRRCLVCRPYDVTEGDTLLAPADPESRH